MLSNSIAKLVQYGIESGLTPECERSYTINLLLDVFHEDEFVEPEEKAADVDLEETLNRIADAYQDHMNGKRGFPHEIGLVLGYPPVDVEGFIEKEGRDFLYSGYWKVYGNLEDTLKTFEAYDQARDYVIGMTGNGNEIRDILAAS